MSLGAVPDADEMIIFGGMGLPGRQLRTWSGVPVAWVTDRAFYGAGPTWADLGEKPTEPGLNGFRRADETFRKWPGLQPFLLSGMSDEPERPWDPGEAVREPEDAAAIDRTDADCVLEGRWGAPDENELAEDEDLRAMFAPFGTRFPGLAPAVEEELNPELMRRAVFQYTRDARIGLVPAARPADILPRLGWCTQSITGLELAVVLRSWEDRFGARLLEVGIDEIRLLVSRPPQTLEAAHRIAAEHFAFADEAHKGLRGVGEIALAVVNNPFWDFWWD